MFKSFVSGEKKKDLYQSYAKDTDILIQEEICNFMTQLMYFMHDGYITAFTTLISRSRELESATYLPASNHWGHRMLAQSKQFMLQIFMGGKTVGAKVTLLPEVADALEYKDIKYLYESTQLVKTESAGEELFRLITREFICAKDEKLENLILEVLIGSQFKLSEYGRFLENLFFITNDKCKDKQYALGQIIPQLSDLINHSSNSLNVSDIKNLKQVSVTMGRFKVLLTHLYDLFLLVPPEPDLSTKRHRDIVVANETELDPGFTKLFIKTKGYLVIIEFLKLCAGVKLEAASNVLEGNEQLGLHAVTVSKELLQVIELCNYILINFCKSTTKAKMYPAP
ncbi:MAG: hypothetical protein P4M11_02665 [Candidatus Pacebacteria bacterium]|nr:hypothetical protein [Candidatus Paceibacterota bacterium]